MVAERLAPGQADLLPHRLGQRLGGDHQRVDRHHVALVPGQARRVALGGAHDHVGAHRAVRRLAAPGRDRGDGGPFEHPHTAALHSTCQAAHQPRRVQRSAVGRVRRAHGAAGPHDRLGPGPVEQAQVVVTAAPGAGVLDLGAGPGQLRGAAGQVDGAALGELGVDALRCRRPGDLVDAGPHRGVLGQGRRPPVPASVGAVQPCQGVERGGEERRAPAAVAPRRAVAGDLGLQHRDPQGRVGLGEVVRRPQPRQAGAHEGHVDVEVAAQRGPRRPVVAGRGVPQRQRPVVLGGGDGPAQRTPQE